MNGEILQAALIGGERNHEIKKYISYFIDICSVLENRGGKIYLYATLMSFDCPAALGLQAWDGNEHCSALVTHDLHSFTVHDLGALSRRR